MTGELGQPWETRRGGLGTGLSFETPSLKWEKLSCQQCPTETGMCLESVMENIPGSDLLEGSGRGFCGCLAWEVRTAVFQG